MITIDERTKIPLFAGLVAAVSMLGFVFWLSSVYSLAAKANEDNIKQDIKMDMLYQIKEDVAVIKEKLIKQGK